MNLLTHIIISAGLMLLNLAVPFTKNANKTEKIVCTIMGIAFAFVLCAEVYEFTK